MGKKKKSKKKKQGSHKETRSEHRKAMNEELMAIYAEQDGEMPDLSKLDQKKGQSFTRILLKLVIGLAVIAAVAWGGFLVWTQGVFQDREILVTEIEGPESVRSGEEVFYTLRYDNSGDVPIAALEMQLNLPPGFELTSTSPTPTNETTWTIGSLESGSDGSIVIGGIFRSEVPSTESLQAFFTYRPANFSSDFQDIQTLPVDIRESILSLTISGPEKALPGDVVEYIINAQNTGRSPAKNVDIILDVPEDFALQSAEPAPSEEAANVWRLAELAPGELVAITLNGEFTSSVSGEQNMTARAVFVNEDEIRLTQTQSDVVTDILGGGVHFTLIVDGSTNDVTTDLEDRVRVSIDYANNSEDAVEGFALKLILTADSGLPIDWEELDVGDGRVSGNTITWDQETTKSFALLEPGAVGVIDATIPIVGEIDPALLADAFTVELTGSMSKIGAVESPRSIDATPITVRINSDLTASAEARYYTEDGDALGTGPLPPTVDESTSYHVIWTLENTLHPLENIVVTTTLPTDVQWRDQTTTDIGSINFNETTRLVSWNIDRLPTDLTEATASFELVISPTESDAGSFFKLTNATSVSSQDTVSGAGLSRAIDVLTTELSTDEYAEGKGVVIE